MFIITIHTIENDHNVKCVHKATKLNKMADMLSIWKTQPSHKYLTIYTKRQILKIPTFNVLISVMPKHCSFFKKSDKFQQRIMLRQ